MNRKSKAFTLAEIIIVMMLIAFLWTCVVKVINKNMENKVKVYLFNIYNELQYAGKATDKTLSKNKNESIQDILLETNAINYCDAFVSNINSSNAVDCVQGTSEFMVKKDVKPNILNTFTCTRTYKYKVNSNGGVNETYSPTKSDYVRDISPYSKNYQNLLTESAKTGNKYYSCSKETTYLPKDEDQDQDEAGEFKLEQRLTNQAFVSSNNVSFYFITTKSLIDNSYLEKDVYNYSANVYQDAICDAAPTGSSVLANDYKNLFIHEPYRINGKYGTSYNVKEFNSKIKQVRFGSASKNDVGIFKAQKGVSVCGEYLGTIQNKIPNLYDEDRCKTFFNLYNDYGNKQCCVYASSNKGTSQTCKKTWKDGTWKNVCTTKYCYEEICQSKIPCVQMPVKIGNDYASQDQIANFYNKWNNYFKNNFNSKVFYNSGTNLTNANEGTEEKTVKINGDSSLTYPNHFIYVAIDNAFKYGTYGKDVFAFEHFGSKIIPVGILANDKNSPLKFNVITRDLYTKKIERLNKEPLNFCEAMKYTGEKFSQYCACKDDGGNIVTQYNDNNVKAECLKGFGCAIRPINPSISRFK